MGSAANFKSLSKHAAVWPHRTTHCINLRNHGASPNTPTPMTIDSLAADVAATLRSLVGPSPAHIVGHSLGGKVAMALALAHPTAVQRLVVADIAPATYSTQDAQWGEVASICAAVAAIDPTPFAQRKEGTAALTKHGVVRGRMRSHHALASQPSPILHSRLIVRHSFCRIWCRGPGGALGGG